MLALVAGATPLVGVKFVVDRAALSPEATSLFVHLGLVTETNRRWYVTEPGRHFVSHDYLDEDHAEAIINIGKLRVDRLTFQSVDDVNPLCSSYHTAERRYGFEGTVELNTVGQSLYQRGLLYVRHPRDGRIARWRTSDVFSGTLHLNNEDDERRYGSLTGDEFRLRSSFALLHLMTRKLANTMADKRGDFDLGQV